MVLSVSSKGETVARGDASAHRPRLRTLGGRRVRWLATQQDNSQAHEHHGGQNDEDRANKNDYEDDAKDNQRVLPTIFTCHSCR